MSSTTAVELPVDVSQLDTAKPLDVVFLPFQSVLDKWKEKAASLTVTRLDQTAEMFKARSARLELKDARVTLDKTRKGMVEGLKARTGKIDEAARTIRVEMEKLEAQLLESELFAERHAQKLREELIQKRTAALQPFVTGPILINLEALSDAEFDASLSDAKAAHEARLEAAAKAEAARAAQVAADAAERKRLKAENEELERKAAEATKAVMVERRRVQALEDNRRAAEAKIIAEKKAAEDEVIKAKRVEQDALQAEAFRLAAETDKQKLASIAGTLRGIPTAALSHPGHRAELQVRIANLATWIDGVVNDL
jgi:hypothetical protein